MENKINIAAILKNKPQGTKLYDWLHNIDVELDTISTTDTETVVWCTNETDKNTTCHRGYSEFGTERGYPDGLQILFPSKEMRDWEKLSWKKGDVLIGDCGFVCIFKEWASDDYTKFNGCYFDGMPNAETAKYSKLDNNTAYGYIREIENRCGGKLNLETLEIEKQPEFKDGDIAFADYGHKQAVFIVSDKTGLSEGYNSFIALDLRGLTLDMGCMIFFKKDLCKLRLATEEEKQQLFNALAKENKAWDTEKKQIVDLKPKVELKPFDKVLVRNCYTQRWRVNFFSSITKEGCYICASGSWNECIPYNEETAKLIGTTKDVDG